MQVFVYTPTGRDPLKEHARRHLEITPRSGDNIAQFLDCYLLGIKKYFQCVTQWSGCQWFRVQCFKFCSVHVKADTIIT